MTKELSVIVCVYNEINRLEEGLNGLMGVLSNGSLSHEVIVIDNCSSDGSTEYIKSYNDENVVKIFNDRNLGKGGSIKKGISQSVGDVVVIFDPDGEYDAKDVFACVDALIKKNAECVLGSRILDNEMRYHYLINYWGVRLLTGIINFTYRQKLTDAATAIKVFDGAFIRNIFLKRNGFNLDFELVCRVARCGGLIVEVPASYFPRSKRDGKKIRAIKDGFLSLVCILVDRIVPLKRIKIR